MFLEYLEMWFKRKASEEKREKLDPRGPLALTDPQGLLVLLVR